MIRLILPIPLILLVVIAGEGVVQAELEQVAEFRLSQPEVLAARVNELFAGTKTPHPASALTAWKRATRGMGSLGKPLEAVISFFNPEMAREWSLFDGATLRLWSGKGPASGRLDWSLAVPHDDGTLEAFLVAGFLTEGSRLADLPAHRGMRVDRLGPEGAPVACHLAGSLLIAGTADALDHEVREVESSRGRISKTDPAGIRFRLESGLLSALVPGRSDIERAVAELSRICQGRRIEGFSTLRNDEISVQFRSIGGQPDPGLITPARQIDPAWLRGIADDRAVAMTCWRFDPAPSNWNLLFGLIDRIDKADPAKARTMPVRMRLNLLLGVAKVQPEVDLWPHLAGVTLCLRDDPSSPGATLAIHLEDEASARRIREQFVPRVAATYLAGAAPQGAVARSDSRPVEAGSTPEKLGEVLGKPLRVSRADRTVLLLWGEATPEIGGESADGRNGVSLSSDPRISRPTRVSYIWPGRLSLGLLGLAPDSPTGRVLREAGPAIWYGGMNRERTQSEDLIVWKNPGTFVKRFLETIPLETADSRGPN